MSRPHHSRRDANEGASKGWSTYVGAFLDQNPGRSYIGDTGEVLDASSRSRVVGLGAICGLRTRDPDDARSQSFWVSEFAALANGRRVILHEARGFTVSAPIGSDASGVARPALTRENVEDAVLAVVLPDPEDGEEHPWAWLAHLARTRGLDVTAEQLKGCPYEVVLTDGVSRWSGGSSS